MERIMVIAGGEWQVPLVKKCRELGYEVLNSNLYADSPGFAHADFKEVANVLDRETNLELAKKYHIQAVLTDESDIAVPTVAYVAKNLGLVGISEELAELFTNKFRMREFCKLHRLPSPEYALCKSAREAERFLQAHAGTSERWIMKPLDSQSSRGVSILESPKDAHRFFEEAVQYSSKKEAVIVERYIEGTEFTVDGIVVNGRHYSLAISEKKHYAHNPSIASELFFSHKNSRFSYEQLRAQNDALVEAAGLPFGLTHAEYKFENGSFYLIEIAARGGGTRISSHIVPLLSGVDNYRLLIDQAFGKKVEAFSFEKEKYENRCAVLKFLEVPAQGGIVREILGVEEILSNPGVLELRLEFQVGDRLYQAKDDRSRVGFYIAYGESEEELRKTMEEVERTLQIRQE